MASDPNPVTSMLIKAQRLSGDFNELLQKSSGLLAESESLEQTMIECCGVQDDQLLKNLVKHCNDEERVQHLLEHVELKQTVDEYKAGVEHIMDKYKEHCEGNILQERYNLREKYVARLQAVVNGLDKRIEDMTLIMLFAVGLEEEHSNDNKRTIQQLAQENEQMRHQLQISSDSGEKNCFQLGLPPKTESGTQIEPDDTISMDSDSVSVDSFTSFSTCVSSGYECQSTDNSTVSGNEAAQLH